MGLTPNVVANAPILSSWGNEIRDRTAQRFATAAERAAQWTAPPKGALSVLDDNPGIVFIYTGTAWIAAPWSLPWGILGIAAITTTTSSANAVPVDIAGATLTFTSVPNRRYLYTLVGHTYVNPAGAGAIAQALLVDAGNVARGTPSRFDNYAAPTATVASFVTLLSQEVPGVATAITRKWRVNSIAGGNAAFFADPGTGRSGYFMVQDIGPAGAAP